MRIDRLSGRAPGTARTRRSRGGFALPDEPNSPPQESAAASEAAGVTAPEAPGHATVHPARMATDQAAAEGGRAVLQALDGLHLASLGGRDPEALLTLARLASGLAQAADPRLDSLLKGIAARAAVELARSG